MTDAAEVQKLRAVIEHAMRLIWAGESWVAYEALRAATAQHCLACGGEVKPCGDHWHHVTRPDNPHFPQMKESA